MKKLRDRNPLDGFDDLFARIDFSAEEEPWELFPEISLCGKKKKHSHRKNNKTSTAPQYHHCNMKKGRGISSSSICRLSNLTKHNLVLKDRVYDLLMAEYNMPFKASTSHGETSDSQMWDGCDVADLEQYLSPGFPELLSGDQGNWEKYVLLC